MSTAKGVASLLNKLDKALGKNREKNSNTNDYKALNEARKKAFTKCNDGKNQFVFLVPDGFEDPFSEWGFHTNLEETAYFSTPCDEFNKNEDCMICNVVEGLKSEDFEKNKHIWMPIQRKTEFYAPVINVSSEETIKEGPKWLKLPKTVMNQIVEWIKNTEFDAGEKLFFDEEEPQRIIINFDKDAQPKDKYKLDKKNTRAFTSQQLADWKGTIQPIGSYFQSKSQEQIKKLVDSYFERIENMVSEAISTSNAVEEVKKTVSSEKEKVTSSKLDALKSKK